MVGPKAIGMNLPAGLLTGLAYGVEEPTTVLIVIKDGIATIAATHDVVNGAGILNSQLARDDSR
jgi:hypothetical protein